MTLYIDATKCGPLRIQADLTHPIWKAVKQHQVVRMQAPGGDFRLSTFIGDRRVGDSARFARIGVFEKCQL